jgi:F420-non-reducing hydrogenase iron-sulfur subunit
LSSRIVCFHCSHAAEDAIDLAGQQHRQYGSNVVLIRLPCSGRAEERHILKEFREGADAVLVVGCLEGNCSHRYGSIAARKKVDRVKSILDDIGLSGERLEMVNVASNQGWKFPEMVKAMEAKIERLGRNPLGGG